MVRVGAGEAVLDGEGVVKLAASFWLRADLVRVGVATGLDSRTGMLILADELGVVDLERKGEVTLWAAIILRVVVGVKFVTLDAEGSGTSEGRAVKVTCGTKLFDADTVGEVDRTARGRAVNVGSEDVIALVGADCDAVEVMPGTCVGKEGRAVNVLSGLVDADGCAFVGIGGRALNVAAGRIDALVDATRTNRLRSRH